MAGLPDRGIRGPLERMLRMDQVHVVRHKVLVEGRSQRRVARELGLSRTTVGKYVGPGGAGAEGGGRTSPAAGLGQGGRAGRRRCSPSRRSGPAGKQRLTATRLHALLVAEGHAVGVTAVKAAVAEWKRQRREVFVPLTYRPGDLAEVDFFEVLVDVDGTASQGVAVPDAPDVLRPRLRAGSTSGRIKSAFSTGTSARSRTSTACPRAWPTTICGRPSCGSWSAARVR